MRRAGLLATAALLAGLPALASGGEGGWTAPLWHLPTIFWQIFNFALVVALLVYLLKDKAPAFFRGRAEAIRKDLEKALREKEAALERLREVEAKMANLQDEVAAIEREALAGAEAEKERILKEAEAARDRIRAEATEEMARRVSAARKELRSYGAEVVERLAREEIQKGLTEKDEAHLVEQFLTKLEAEAHEHAG